MTVPEFLAWAADQPRGRYELVCGEVVAMAPERARHNLVKAALLRALDEAVKRAGLPCTVVVEIASPSSERDDTGDKLVEYFSVPSIVHYLIVNPVKKVVIHHARSEAGAISTQILSAGEVELTPPGMTVPVDALLPPMQP